MSHSRIFSFLKYENEYEKEDTIIYKYDQIEDEVVELGKVKGYFHDCVINEEETVITGILFDKLIVTEWDVVRYDIAAGTTEYLNIEEIVNKLTTGNAKKLMIYDVKTGNAHCIYKENLTIHEFGYVARR